MKTSKTKHNIPWREITREYLRHESQVWIKMQGTSMFPYLRQGDTAVVRSVAGEDLEIGDIIVFSKAERFFAHRIIRKQSPEILICKGDSMPEIDSPVSMENVYGKIIAIERGRRFIDFETSFRRKLHYWLARFSVVSSPLFRFSRWLWHNIKKR